MKRIFHHYSKWEEISAGMWRKIGGKERERLLQDAIAFTGDAKSYGHFMRQALDQWPISCEQNLSNKTINRKAWIGHAAVCIALGCSEDVTREAWHHLTQQQQDEANLQAEQTIQEWERRMKEKKRAQKKVRV